MTALNKLPVAVDAAPPKHAAAAASLRDGQPFTCILSDDPAERAALRDATVRTAVDLDTRFVEIGNPLRAPLTIERLFLQAVGPEADIRLERGGEALARILAHRVGNETRLIIVITQAETLDTEAINTLRSMAPSFASMQPRVQILFVGTTAFAAMLEPLEPSAPQPARTAEPPPAETTTPAPLPWSAPPPRRRSRVPLILAVALGAIAAAGLFAWKHEPALLHRLGLPIPASTEVAPAAEAAPSQKGTAALEPSTQAGAPQPTPTESTANDATASLRREFDRFLTERPDLAKLTEARKDELFEEFLQRRRTQGASAPP